MLFSLCEFGWLVVKMIEDCGVEGVGLSYSLYGIKILTYLKKIKTANRYSGDQPGRNVILAGFLLARRGRGIME